MKHGRWIAIGVAFLLVTAAGSPAQAQFGAIKKKIKEQVAGKGHPADASAPAQGAAAPAGSAAAAGSQAPLSTSFYTPAYRLAITPAVVDQFLTGLRAEVAERNRIAAAQQTDPNVVRFWRRHDRRMHCDTVAKAMDAELESAQHAMQTASTEAAMKSAMQRIQDAMAAKNKGCDPGEPPEMVQSFFDNLRTAESSMDVIGAGAAGLTRGQYAYLRERIAALALSDAHAPGPNVIGPPVGYSPSEMAAVRARASVLVPLLLRDFIPTGERAPSSSY